MSIGGSRGLKRGLYVNGGQARQHQEMKFEVENGDLARSVSNAVKYLLIDICLRAEVPPPRRDHSEGRIWVYEVQQNTLAVQNFPELP